MAEYHVGCGLSAIYAVPLFWLGWIIFCLIIVFGFMYLDNQWLE